MMCRAWYADRSDWQDRDQPAVMAWQPAPAGNAEDHVSEGDRDRARDVLVRAFTEGVLRVDEFDQRLSEVYDARTVGDLQAVIGQLPASWLTDVAEDEVRRRRAEKLRRRQRHAVGAYLRTMALLVGIWLVIGMTADAWYPWVVWPALGWGIPLLLSRGSPHHPSRLPTPRRHGVSV